ncbi:MAG TPA: sialate O-acetylesterase, partial [Isosphaeraceae bacterium]
GFYFAAALRADPALGDIPVGVIDSSFGGSLCEAWVPKRALSDFAPADLRLSLFGAGPSGYYNAMIAPLGWAPIKGVVWYQGESNADRPGAYPRLLAALVASWRGRFETPDLPFVVIQLPAWANGSDGLSWAWLREAQAQAVRATPQTSLAVTIDTTDGFDLHPRQKAEVGRRSALLALRDVYGRPIVASGPAFLQAKVEGGALRVMFATGGDGLVSRGSGPVRGFAIAGADGRYLYADATIEGDAVVLRSAGVPAPKTVRYAWAGVPDANLADRSGLPAAPFRTDGLRPPDADVHKQPVARHIRMKAYEVTVDGTGSVTSLGVGGKQFLSNALGGSGVTSVPGWSGPRSLADVRDPGPGLVSCGDSEVTLLMQFGEKGMEWEVTNRGKDGIKFRIPLGPRVAVSGRGGRGPLTLTREAASLTVEGVDEVVGSDDGRVLEAAVAGRATKRLVLTVGGP